MSKRIGDPQRRWVDRLRRQRIGAVMDKPAAKPSGPPPLGKPWTGVTDEMVERGLRERYGDRYIDSLDEDWRIEKNYEMRKILTAALGDA